MFNFPISISSFNKIDDNLIISIILKYLKNNKCCINYPKCNHPKEQSDPNVFKIKNKEIQKLKQSYFLFLNKLIGKYLIKESKCWALYVKKETTTPSIWHIHFDNKEQYKDCIQISGIYYLTDTDIGTEFNDYFFNIETKPKKGHWFIWDSRLNHRPKDCLNPKDRLIIATQTILKK